MKDLSVTTNDLLVALIATQAPLSAIPANLQELAQPFQEVEPEIEDESWYRDFTDSLMGWVRPWLDRRYEDPLRADRVEMNHKARQEWRARKARHEFIQRGKLVLEWQVTWALALLDEVARAKS